MSTRATIIIKDAHETLYFYRHSDGYPSHCGKDLVEFVKDYTSGAMRDNASQSAGWLILRGHVEYNVGKPCFPQKMSMMTGWKCGAYEPATGISGDTEYVYTIDLVKRRLTCKGVEKMAPVVF